MMNKFELSINLQRVDHIRNQKERTLRRAEHDEMQPHFLGLARNISYMASNEQVASALASFGIARRDILPKGKVRLLCRNSGQAILRFSSEEQLKKCIQAAQEQKIRIDGRAIRVLNHAPKGMDGRRSTRLEVPCYGLSFGAWDGLERSCFYSLVKMDIADSGEHARLMVNPSLRVISVVFQEKRERTAQRICIKTGTVLGDAHLSSDSGSGELVLSIAFNRPPFFSKQCCAISSLMEAFSEFFSAKANKDSSPADDDVATTTIASSLEDNEMMWRRENSFAYAAHCNAVQLRFRRADLPDLHQILRVLSTMHIRPQGEAAASFATQPLSTVFVSLPSKHYATEDIELFHFRILCTFDLLRSSLFGAHCELRVIQPLYNASKAVVSGSFKADAFHGGDKVLALSSDQRQMILATALEKLATYVGSIGNHFMKKFRLKWLMKYFYQSITECVDEMDHDQLSRRGQSDSSVVFIRRVIVTPSRILYRSREAESPNRAIRIVAQSIGQPLSEAQDLFVRVSFVDENMRPYFVTNPSGENDSENVDQLFNRIKSTLENGVMLGGRQFHFIGWSNAMIKEHAVWMMANPAVVGLSLNAITSTTLRSRLGNFNGIKVVAKWAARLAQCYSATIATDDVASENIRKVPDITCMDTNRRSYTFSDGVGTICLKQARESFADYCRKKGLLDPLVDYLSLCPPVLPSAFQIRLGGMKGVLSLDVLLNDAKITVRPSMNKFESYDQTLEICKVARRIPFFLNRQIIILLNTLQVDENAVMSLLERNLELLDLAAQDTSVANQLLLSGNCSTGGAISSSALAQVLFAGFNASTEPFLHSLLLATLTGRLHELRYRARIYVPKGAVLMGVMDEKGLLQQGEVFFNLTSELFDSRGSTVVPSVERFPAVTMEVFVTRCPCFHPGDIRFVRAVSLSDVMKRVSRLDEKTRRDFELYYSSLCDVLVFPQHGSRPHSNEMSGGDLDGDEYFICWEPTLFPPPSERNFQPMDFTINLQPPTKDDITEEDIQRFFVKFIESDNLGIVAIRHLVLADMCDVMAKDEKCLLLASLHSTAVDFQKTGIAADLSPYQQLLRVTKYPDFLENNTKDEYESERILGKVYRRVVSATRKSNFANKQTYQSYQNVHIDSDLCLDGRSAFDNLAEELFRKYTFDLQAIMNKFGILSEAEIFSGHVEEYHEKAYARKKPVEVEEMLAREMQSLRRKIRRLLFAAIYDHIPPAASIDACSDDAAEWVDRMTYEALDSPQQRCMECMVSALYTMAYGEPSLCHVKDDKGNLEGEVIEDNNSADEGEGGEETEDDIQDVDLRHPHFLSLPWLFPEVLAAIKRNAVQLQQHSLEQVSRGEEVGKEFGIRTALVLKELIVFLSSGTAYHLRERGKNLGCKLGKSGIMRVFLLIVYGVVLLSLPGLIQAEDYDLCVLNDTQRLHNHQDCTLGEVQLLSTYVHVGIHSAGSFGTKNFFNSSYFNNKLGIIADYKRVGFEEQAYSGDFIYAIGRTIVEGFLVKYTLAGSTTITISEGLAGRASFLPNLFLLSSDNVTNSALWIATSSDLAIRMVFNVDKDDLHVITSVTIKNIASSTITNLFCKITHSLIISFDLFVLNDDDDDDDVS
eukprot:scaffold409_cov167-Ochromonas_danica.AAC.25